MSLAGKKTRQTPIGFETWLTHIRSNRPRWSTPVCWAPTVDSTGKLVSRRCRLGLTLRQLDPCRSETEDFDWESLYARGLGCALGMPTYRPAKLAFRNAYSCATKYCLGRTSAH